MSQRIWKVDGQKIAALRDAKFWSQQDLADEMVRISVGKRAPTRRTIQRLEASGSAYGYTIRQVAQALGVSDNALVGSTVGEGYVRLIEREVTSFDLPDLLTPGPSAPDLVAALASQMGSPLAHRLGILSESNEGIDPANPPYLGHTHALYSVSFAERAESLLVGPEQVTWFGRLEADHDNLRAALDWLEESGDIDTATRITGALSRFWYVHGHLSETRIRLKRLLQKAAGRPGTEPWAKALVGAGLLAREQGNFLQARALLQKAIRVYRDAPDQRSMARVLYYLGILEGRDGHHEQARALYDESLDVARAVGDDWTIASAWRGISHEAVAGGEYTQARDALEESLRYFRRVGDPRGLAISLRFFGELAIDFGDHSTARAQLRASLQILTEFDDRWSINNVLLALSRLAAVEGWSQRALRLAGAATALRLIIGTPLPLVDQSRIQQWLAPTRQTMNARDRDALLEEGKMLKLDQAVAYALEDDAV